MKKVKIIIRSILFAMALMSVIIAASYILAPKIPSFYKEKDYNVVFFGTSESYCSFDPKVFDEYGLKTYNRGRPQQTIIRYVPESEQISYLFPLDKYHNRWEELLKQPLRDVISPYYEEEERGFVRMTEQVVCVDDYWSIAFSEVRRDVYEKNMESLQKIYEFFANN